MTFKVDGNITNLTGNGNSAEVTVLGAAHVSVLGTWGGGTATLQMKGNDDTWRAIANGAWTEDTSKAINFPAGSKNLLRVVLSGATSPDLDVIIHGMGAFDRG